jgi:ABC-type lipoprotein export system ATPase subunit
MYDDEFSRGSEWRKWDLHVHTPFSYLNNQFGSNFDDYVQQMFKKAIENNIAAIGITDYFSIEGYKKIKEEYLENQNNLALLFSDEEIEKIKKILILPNIEFRLNKLVGTQRINFHVIFSNEISIKQIEENFLREIKFVYEGAPQTEEEKRALTKSNLEELGRKLKREHQNFQSRSDIEVGAMNAVISDEDIIKILTNKKSIFEGKYLIFIPADEDLSKVSWDGEGHQTRKVLIQKSDGLFASNPNTIKWGLGYKHPGNNREEKIENFVNEFKTLKPCIWGSDAHDYDKLFEPDMKRYTWIKADPTFEGLKQIKYEPEERVFIGEEPDLLRRIRENKTKFIKHLIIDQVSNYNGGKGEWFKNIEIPINPGMVAIIGNKEMGKSALLDIIALCGNSHESQDDFSFLNKNRFKKDNLAKNFEVTLIWEDGEECTKNLDNDTDKTVPEKVRYLPQNYFERLTNDLEGYDFEKTLEDVVFRHLPSEEKLGKNSFRDLVAYKEKIIDKEINVIIDEIQELNKKIAALEYKKNPTYRIEISNKLEEKKKELKEHEKIKPQEVKNQKNTLGKDEPQQKLIKKVERLNKIKKSIETLILRENEKVKYFKIQLENLNNFKRELLLFRDQINNLQNDFREKFQKIGLNFEQIVTFKINFNLLDSKEKEIISYIKMSKKKIDIYKKGSEELDKRQKEINDFLSVRERLYQKYLHDLEEWKKKEEEIIGDENTKDSIKWLKKELEYIDKTLDKALGYLRSKRIENTLKIFNKKMEIVDIYQKFKKSIDEEMYNYQDILREHKFNIEAALMLSSDFSDKFLEFIDKRKQGSFNSLEEAKKILSELSKNYNPSSKEGVSIFLEKIIEFLEFDQREGFKGKERNIFDQISRDKILEFYKYVFSLEYLKPVYQLKLDNKTLEQLSPGERGALLIVFYLIFDKDNIPLLIDQPEENLDNESIYKILTHFLRLAKQRRQIFIVTHNPNLAIVGDAEQIIFVNIDKENKHKFSFKAGAIENPVINKHACDVLEGTLKAFNIRRLKYLEKSELPNEQTY